MSPRGCTGLPNSSLVPVNHGELIRVFHEALPFSIMEMNILQHPAQEDPTRYSSQHLISNRISIGYVPSI